MKTRIFLLRALDWLLLIGVAAGGIYGVLQAERPELAALAALAGLFLVDKFGDFVRTRVARVSVEAEKKRPYG